MAKPDRIKGVKRGVKIALVYREPVAPPIDQRGREGSAIADGDPVIYVIGFADYVKIGFTRSLQARLRMFQSHAPEPIIVYACFHGTMADERRFLARFAEERLQGEWFRKAGRLAQWLDEMAERDRRKGAA
jgi:hypothetical protein